MLACLIPDLPPFSLSSSSSTSSSLSSLSPFLLLCPLLESCSFRCSPPQSDSRSFFSSPPLPPPRHSRLQPWTHDGWIYELFLLILLPLPDQRVIFSETLLPTSFFYLFFFSLPPSFLPISFCVFSSFGPRPRRGET